MSDEALLFEVGGQKLALPLASIQEAIRAVWPMPLPRAPFGCLGIIDVRGQGVPMLDLGVVLGLRRRIAADRLAEHLLDRHVLLMRAAEGAVALLVDHVLEVGSPAPLDDAAKQTLATHPRAQPLVCGIAQAGSERALLLSVSALLTTRRQKLLRRAVTQGAPRAA